MGNETNYPSNLVEVSTTIAMTASESAAINLQGLAMVGLIMPTPFTGTALTIEAAGSDGVYRPVVDISGNAVTFTVAANQHVALDPDTLLGVRALKLFSSAVETAARTVTILGRPVR